MRYAQIVLGPAGAGKSTYCHTIQTHGANTNRNIRVVNLDPAAEEFEYTVTADIRDLVSVSDVMEADDMNYGPNGALVFCMEYFLEFDGQDWLKDQLSDGDDDYFVFDFPGQIELYTHMDIVQRFSANLQSWDFRVCAVFLLDTTYMIDANKFLSGSLTALSTMIKLELPQLNVLTKMDLLNKEARKNLEMFLEPDIHDLLASGHSTSRFNEKYKKLTHALGQVLENFSLVRFVPLNINNEESIDTVMLQINSNLQYGEDADVKTTDYDYQDPDEDEGRDDYSNYFQ